MVIGVCKVSLHFDEAFSLKEKRMIVRSVLDRIKNKFNVAIAETSNQEKYQLSEIGIACVSNESTHVNSMLSSICNFVEADARLVVNNIEREIIYMD